MILTNKDFGPQFASKAKQKQVLQEVATLQAVNKKQKKIKKAVALFGKLLILAVVLAYVLSSIWGADAAYEQAYSNKTNLNISPEVLQQVQTSPEPSPVQVSSTPTPKPTKVIVAPTSKVKSTPKPTKKGIYRFVAAYNGSKINAKYIDSLFAACGNDTASVAKVVGIALAETGLGRDSGKTANFYGWYPNGNRKYDPSLAEMAKVMCKAVGNTGAYKNIGVNYDVTKRYTGSDGTGKWIERFNWAIKRMGVEK